MLPSVPIFTVDNFFRHNIWHSIFDKFHFHHIFGGEMTVSSHKTGKGTTSRDFSLNIWVVYQLLEIDWCILDQNWAKTRLLHYQIFQILNATDRPIVFWIHFKEEVLLTFLTLFTLLHFRHEENYAGRVKTDKKKEMESLNKTEDT